MELVKLFGFENGSYLDAYPQVDTIDTTGAIITYVERIDVLPFVATGQEFPHKWSKNQPTENSARYCPQNWWGSRFSPQAGKRFLDEKFFSVATCGDKKAKGLQICNPLADRRLWRLWTKMSNTCYWAQICAKSKIGPSGLAHFWECTGVMNPVKNVRVQLSLIFARKANGPKGGWDFVPPSVSNLPPKEQSGSSILSCQTTCVLSPEQWWTNRSLFWIIGTVAFHDALSLKTVDKLPRRFNGSEFSSILSRLQYQFPPGINRG